MPNYRKMVIKVYLHKRSRTLKTGAAIDLMCIVNRFLIRI